MSASRVAGHGRWALVVVLGTITVVASVLGLGQVIGWWQIVEVQGGSMQPTIANGAALLTTPRTTEDVRPGDVVSFVGADGHRVTHRVVAVDPTGAVTTRGDANSVDDATPYTGDVVDLVRVVVPGAGVGLRAFGLVVSNPWIIGGGVLAIALALPRPRARRGAHRRTEDLAVQP